MFRDDSGHLDIWEINASGAAVSSATMTINGGLAAVGDATLLGQSRNLLGAGGADLILQDDSGNLDIWEINTAGTIVSTATVTFNGTPGRIGASSLIGESQNLLGAGGGDLILKDTSGNLDIWEINTAGVAIDAATVMSRGTPAKLGGSTLVAEGQNFLGDGGADLFLRDGNGHLIVWEINAAGNIVANVQITTNGAPLAVGSSEIVASGQNLFGTGGHDLFMLQNGTVSAWEINDAGAVTATPSTADVQRLIAAMATFGAGTDGAMFGGMSTQAEQILTNVWHIATPH